MLRKALTFVVTHKLAVAALFLPFGVAISAAILAYQHRHQKPNFGPVRDAVDEPIAPPSIDELENAPEPEWHH